MNKPVELSAERHQRHTHLVGSLPFADANESMSESLSRLGDSLLYLSDGETAERGDYVSHLADLLGSNPALKGKKQVTTFRGQQGDRTVYRIQRGRKYVLQPGELGYFEAWEASLPLFREMHDQVGNSKLRYLMAMATPFSIAAPFFQPPFHIFRAIKPLQQGLRDEISRAAKKDGSVLTVQLDAAFEQVIVAAAYEKFPPAARLLAWIFAGQIVKVLEGIPTNIPIGVHLCYGNPSNERIVTPSSSKPTVLLANTIVRRLPSKYSLDYIHFPMVDSTDQAHYDPLAKFEVDPQTRLIAGLVFEDGHEANVARLRLAAESLGFVPDVACACGMGRRTPDVARGLLDEMAQLTHQEF